MKVNTPDTFLCYVVFVESHLGHWWIPFMKKRYNHCFVLIPVDDGTTGLLSKEGTIVVDPGINILKTVLCDHPIKEVIRDLQSALFGGVTEVLECRLANSGQTGYSIEILTCVSLVKLTLGLRWRTTWTPWQLRNKLIRSGIGKFVEGGL